MRADRLLSILMLLQVHRKMTAQDLARRLEVCERTIHRDMTALGSAGIPVLAERGAGGGWCLLEGYRTNLTGLNAVEAQALFLTNPPRLLADLGLEKASDAALLKLLAALPAMQRNSAEYVQQRIHLDVAGWRQSEESAPLLPLLQEAVWQERKLRFTYVRGDGVSVERVVDPLGLVAKGSVWYLVAAVEGEPRSYRVSRLKAAEIVDEACARPEDFDLAAFWSESTSYFTTHLPRYSATLRVEPSAAPRVRSGGWYTRLEREGAPDAEGWIPVVILFDDEHSALEYVLSFGPQMEVIEPQELREQVIRAAEGIVAHYPRGSSTGYAQRGVIEE